MSEKTSKETAAEVEKYLNEERKKYVIFKRQPKLLILGSSDSGKSTLLKQLKIMHGKGFTDEEKVLFTKAIKENIIQSLYVLYSNTEKLEKGNYSVFNKFYEDWTASPEVSITPEVIEQMTAVWKDQKILETYEAGELDNGDILNLRTVTQHISETVFNIDSKIIRFYDVSGLKYHRKSWLTYFDEVHSILFVASLSSYDKYLVEDSTINMMVDSLVLFEQIVNHPLLDKPSFVLFLNKKDLYEKKIQKVDIKNFFPEYADKPKSNSRGISFFKKKFLSQSKKERPIVAHITCCTDTSSMKVIISNLIASVMKDNLKDIGKTHLTVGIVQISKEIEAFLREEKKKYEKFQDTPKMLILGSSDSGKSTLLKQLKILHGSGFEDSQRKDYSLQIRRNIITVLAVLLSKLTDEQLQKYYSLSIFVKNSDGTFPDDIQALIVEFAKEKFTVEISESLPADIIPDNTFHFFSDTRFFKDDYLPTNEDILNLRTVTQSVTMETFVIQKDKGTFLHVFDVSGLINHRKQWVQYFDSVNLILFIVSLSSYDQTLAEDPTKNRMIDAIVLFEQMIDHPLLKKQAFVIFFNKKDVYEKKVKKVNIIDYFPEYHGKPQSVSQGIKFFHSKFLANVKERKVTSHITCCTDTNLMKTIVAAVVKESVKISKDIEKYLKEEKRTYEQYKREPKLLLLGSSDSGKSTLLKQMKILHGSGFSKEEKERSVVNIRKNIYDAVNILVRECTKEVKEVLEDKYAELFKSLSEVDEDGSSAIPNDLGVHIQNLWSEKEIQETFARVGPKMLPDTTEYFFNDISRFLKADYDPTNEVSLSSYDQTMVEDPTVNRMVDALVLFDQIVNNPALSKPDIILFFNKKDLYEKKVKKIPINEFFPEYQG
ncbi:hypothetical protein HDV06_004322 [Boothiomyces sp. JEL0866]|nr:hypothetical protein HDV06_004322 [Boothiomyces sp. JEL0866]